MTSQQIKTAVSITLAFLLVGLFSTVLPLIMMTQSVNQQATFEAQTYATTAVGQTEQLLNPLEKRLQLGKSVSQLVKISNNTGCQMQGATAFTGHFEATVTVRTLFGVPYAKFATTCQGMARISLVSP